MSVLVLSGCIPRSTLNTVLLIVLEDRSIFSVAVFCTAVSNCFTNSAFPSHTSETRDGRGGGGGAGGYSMGEIYSISCMAVVVWP